VFVSASESIEGVLRSAVVNLVADNVELSPAQAREYAGYLLEAATVAEGGVQA